MGRYANFKVINHVELDQDEQGRLSLNESMFFYHSWLRSELELISIAHDILLAHCSDGKNSTYNRTKLCNEVSQLLESDDSETEFLSEVIDELSQLIDDIYNLKNYYCGYCDGDWGLFYNWESELA